MRLRTTLLTGLVLALTPAAPALGAAGVAKFDTIPAGTAVREQVAGLKFGVPLPPGVTGGARLLTVREDPDARSGTRVAELAPCSRGCPPTRTFVHFEGPWPTVVRAWAGTNGSSLLARMRAYDGRGRVLAVQEPVQVLGGAHTNELVVQPGRHIAFVEIEQLPDPRAGNGTPKLTIDDLEWNDPVLPLAGYKGTVSATTLGAGPLTKPVQIRAGRTFEWTVKLEETGGGYGRRRFTVDGVPDEVSGETPLARISIDGKAEGLVTGDTELTVRVTVLEDLPQPTDPSEEQPFAIELVGRPLDPRAGAQPVKTPLGTLRVRPNVTDQGPGPDVAFGGNCGTDVLTGSYSVRVPFIFADGLQAPVGRQFRVEPRVGMTQQALQAGLSFSVAPERVTLDLDTNNTGDTFEVTVRRTKPVTEEVRLNLVSEVRNADGSVQYGTDAALSQIVVRPDVKPTPPQIASAVPDAGRTPQLAKPGTPVTLTGSGFCSGAEVRFGNEKATAPAEVSADGTSITTSVPRLATTGPITVRQGALEAASPGFTVDSFRNTQGYPFANFFLDDLEFKDTVNLFGYEATHIDSLDEVAEGACEFFTLTLGDCDVQLGAREPAALVHHTIADIALSGDDGDAHCFGMAVSSRQLLAGKVPLSKYGAKRIFDIAGPGGLGTGGIRRYLRAPQGAQLSGEFINDFLGYYLKGQIGTTPAVVSRIAMFFQKGIAPVIAMGQGGRGHVVVAYDLEKINDDEWWVYVDDNNDPYAVDSKADPKEKGLVSENGESGIDHRERVERNRIRLRADNRWSYAPLNYGPGKYEGSSHRLMVFDGATQKVRPTLPFSLEGVMHIVFGAGATTTDPGGRQGVPFGSYEGRELAAEVFTKGSRPVIRTITPRGGRRGRYGSYVAGQGFTASLAAEGATPAQRDTMTLDPGDGRLTLSSTAMKRRFGIVAARKARTGSRALRVVGTTAKGARTAIEIDKKGIASVRAGATTTLKLTLMGGAGKGKGLMRKLPPLSVKRGAVVRVVPSSWADVRRAVLVRIKQPGRPTTTRRLAALRR